MKETYVISGHRAENEDEQYYIIKNGKTYYNYHFNSWKNYTLPRKKYIRKYNPKYYNWLFERTRAKPQHPELYQGLEWLIQEY